MPHKTSELLQRSNNSHLKKKQFIKMNPIFVIALSAVFMTLAVATVSTNYKIE